MKILKSIGNFLFGKDADIFDINGNVIHKLPQKKWDAWHNQTKLNPKNNWRNHTGVTGSQSTKPQSK
jgi:hypothetical protein